MAGKKISAILIISIFLFLAPSFIFAEGGSLYFSPASGTFFVGETFDVSIFVNSGGESINAVKVDLKFDPSRLQIASPTAGKSFIEVWVTQPAYSNIEGTASFLGGIPFPGIKTSAGLVSTITFRAISPGETAVFFSDSSKILRNDPKGTDILTSKGRGYYALTIPPPEGPIVFSPTHPDTNKWYKDNNPTFSWEKEEGVTDFSYTFDRDSTGIPDNVSQGSHTAVSYGEIEDGIWYFHIKAKKGGVWGGTSHYAVRIDSTPPASFIPTVDPDTRTVEKQPLISFITTDALSGISHYEIKYIDITSEEEKEVGFFREVSSPYRMPSLEIGTYLIVIRAYDVAGNFKEGTVRIEILPERIVFTRKGIQYQKITVFWWMLIILILIIIILLTASFYRKKKNEAIGKEKRRP